jgi:hypothetical protein
MGSRPNVFFGPIKTHYFGPRRIDWFVQHPLVLSVYARNALVLLASTAACLVALYLILRQQLRTRGL